MGIYAYGKKIYENDEEVIYLYGYSNTNISSKLSINKKKWKEEGEWDAKNVFPENEIKEMLAYERVIVKAIKYYLKNGVFPNEVSFCS